MNLPGRAPAVKAKVIEISKYVVITRLCVSEYHSLQEIHKETDTKKYLWPGHLLKSSVLVWHHGAEAAKMSRNHTKQATTTVR